MTGIDAVVLDVGGVLLLPDPRPIAEALRAEGIGHRPAALADAHYGAVAWLDQHRDGEPGPEVGGVPARYLDGFARAAGVGDGDLAAATTVLAPVFARPSTELWTQEAAGARAGLALLGELGLPVAMVSNADGTVEAQLERHGLAQVGPGPGLEVAAIVDSSVYGVAKPDPRVFGPALDAVGVAASRCAHVGDTVVFDVAGAHAAGLRAIHLDPLGWCDGADHDHAVDLPAAVTAVD